MESSGGGICTLGDGITVDVFPSTNVIGAVLLSGESVGVATDFLLRFWSGLVSQSGKCIVLDCKFGGKRTHCRAVVVVFHIPHEFVRAGCCHVGDIELVGAVSVHRAECIHTSAVEFYLTNLLGGLANELPAALCTGKREYVFCIYSSLAVTSVEVGSFDGGCDVAVLYSNVLRNGTNFLLAFIAILVLHFNNIYHSPYESLAGGGDAPNLDCSEARRRCSRYVGRFFGNSTKQVVNTRRRSPIALGIGVSRLVVLGAEYYSAIARCERAFFKEFGFYLVVVDLNPCRSIGALVVERPGEYIEAIAHVADSNLIIIVAIASCGMFGGIAKSAFASGLPLAGDIVGGLGYCKLDGALTGACYSIGEAFVFNLVVDDVHRHLVEAGFILLGSEGPFHHVVAILEIFDGDGSYIGSSSIILAKTCASHATGNFPLAGVAVITIHYTVTLDIVGLFAGGNVGFLDCGDRFGILYGGVNSGVASVVVLHIYCPSYLLGSTSLDARYCGSSRIGGSECESVGSVLPFAALVGNERASRKFARSAAHRDGRQRRIGLYVLNGNFSLGGTAVGLSVPSQVSEGGIVLKLKLAVPLAGFVRFITFTLVGDDDGILVLVGGPVAYALLTCFERATCTAIIKFSGRLAILEMSVCGKLVVAECNLIILGTTSISIGECPHVCELVANCGLDVGYFELIGCRRCGEVGLSIIRYTYHRPRTFPTRFGWCSCDCSIVGAYSERSYIVVANRECNRICLKALVDYFERSRLGAAAVVATRRTCYTRCNSPYESGLAIRQAFHNGSEIVRRHNCNARIFGFVFYRPHAFSTVSRRVVGYNLNLIVANETCIGAIDGSLEVIYIE